HEGLLIAWTKEEQLAAARIAAGHGHQEAAGMIVQLVDEAVAACADLHGLLQLAAGKNKQQNGGRSLPIAPPAGEQAATSKRLAFGIEYKRSNAADILQAVELMQDLCIELTRRLAAGKIPLLDHALLIAADNRFAARMESDGEHVLVVTLELLL